MLLILTAFLAMAAPADTDPTPSPSGQVVQARASSAARLGAMVGGPVNNDPLTRDTVLEAIARAHPKLRSAEAGLLASEAQFRASRAYLDPVFTSKSKASVAGYYQYLMSDSQVSWDAGAATAEVGWRYGRGLGDGDVPAYYGELKTLDGGEVRVGLSIDLLEGLWTDKQRTGARVAGLSVDQGKALVALARLDLNRKGVASWAKWVAAGRELALDQVLLEVAQQRQRAVDARISVGDLASIERVRNQQFLAERQAELAGAKGAFTSASQDLSLSLRDADGAPLVASLAQLPGRVVAPARAPGFSEDPVVLALDAHPLLQIARSELGIAQAEARVARLSRLPKVSLEGGLSQDLGAGDDSSGTLSPTGATVGASVQIPLGNLSDRNKAAATVAKRDKALADLQFMEERVAAEVRGALAREEASLEMWKASANQVDFALQLQEAEQRRFDVGDIDLLRLWQIEQQTAKAIRNEVKAWMVYQVSVADLQYAVGRAEIGP